MNNSNIIPVILSGGSGSRLWPISRASLPKQYLVFNQNNNYTLLQNTFLRLKGIKNLQKPLIISNEDQRFIVAEQMRKINISPVSILLEPCIRNTAPAIALAAFYAIQNKTDPILLILPADHKIEEINKFKKSIKNGLIFAKSGRLVTFGISPSSPNTGYGYIESEEEICDQKICSNIKSFIEKPKIEIANELIKDKHFSWNSGIFLFKASTILSEIKRYNPSIFDICEKCLENSKKDLDFLRIDNEVFEKCPNISIDNAVMEKTSLGTVVNLDAGWNDLGSWKSIWEDSKLDKNQNTLVGKTFVNDVKDSYLRSENRLLVGLGLRNMLVIETTDAVFVANKESINSLKKLFNELEKNNFKETRTNRKEYRPWGNFISIMEGKRWQVKKLEVSPKESLSLQMHKFRAEHWIVVKGTAKVEIDKKISLLKENESIYIPLGSKHRLSNPTATPLIIIEVQSGSYLGEDDIVRFEDKYRRQTSSQ